MAEKLVGQNYIPVDHFAKVTGRARYAEVDTAPPAMTPLIKLRRESDMRVTFQTVFPRGRVYQ